LLSTLIIIIIIIIIIISIIIIIIIIISSLTSLLVVYHHLHSITTIIIIIITTIIIIVIIIITTFITTIRWYLPSLSAPCARRQENTYPRSGTTHTAHNAHHIQSHKIKSLYITTNHISKDTGSAMQVVNLEPHTLEDVAETFLTVSKAMKIQNVSLYKLRKILHFLGERGHHRECKARGGVGKEL
jgi:hypothetical protein